MTPEQFEEYKKKVLPMVSSADLCMHNIKREGVSAFGHIFSFTFCDFQFLTGKTLTKMVQSLKTAIYNTVSKCYIGFNRKSSLVFFLNKNETKTFYTTCASTKKISFFKCYCVDRELRTDCLSVTLPRLGWIVRWQDQRHRVSVPTGKLYIYSQNSQVTW